MMVKASATAAFGLAMFFSATMVCYGQNDIGLNPPSMKWRQIDTPGGQVIFPKGLDSIAFKAAALMNYQRQQEETVEGDEHTKRVPVILQNQSTLPAGFSTPAPWRNEYYLTPPQNMFLGPILWEIGMPVHEYRHTQQFHQANNGYTWLYKIFMGQTGWLFNSLMTQPLWFREGDAVLAETMFTSGGRGRLPAFHMEYRAMRQAGYHYNYEKIHYPSFRNFVPNAYRTGYYMVTKARREFGENIWKKVLRDTYLKKGFIYPFSRSLKDHTGFGTKQLYDATVKELDSLWGSAARPVSGNTPELISSPQTRKYTSYRFPHYLKDGRVLALKSGLDLINTYYILSDAGERKLFSPGIYSDDHTTTVVEGDLMTWAESRFHERWINQDYSVIKTYNFKTGKTSRLTSRTRWFSPAPSRDGSKLIVSETDTQNRYTLILLDATTGKEITRLPNPEDFFFTNMRWIDNQSIVCVVLNEKGNAVVRVDTETGAVEKLVDETSVPISRPYPHDNYIFFSAGSNEVNNIYALDTASKELFQVTHSDLGAFEPVISSDGSTLLYSEYTADGYRVRELNLEPSSWTRSVQLLSGYDDFLDTSSRQEGRHLEQLHVPSYPVRKYHALTSGLFNFYGWIPLPNIPEYGIELYTQNLMSTLVGTIGYAYNTNENRSRYYARLTYAALYPHIELSFHNGQRRSANILPDSDPEEFYEQDWRQNSISAGLRLPFRLSRGTYQSHLNVAGFYEYYDVSSLDSADLDVMTSNMNFHGVKGEFFFSRLMAQARQHVKPRWGQQLQIDYNKALDDTPERLYGISSFYFPGMFRTHSLNFRLAYKKEEVINSYRFIDDFTMPRGYEPMPFEEIYVASANYELPIWYPDVAAGSVAFFQRLRTNFFFDYSEGMTTGFKQPLTSTGAELSIDLRFFRLFQTTVMLRFNIQFEDPAAGTIPFQFLITRFELAN